MAVERPGAETEANLWLFDVGGRGSAYGLEVSLKRRLTQRAQAPGAGRGAEILGKDLLEMRKLVASGVE